MAFNDMNVTELNNALRNIEKLPDEYFASILSDTETVEAIRARLYVPITGKNTHMNKKDTDDFFNIKTVSAPNNRYEVTEDNNSPRELINRFVAYYGMRIAITPLRNRGALKEVVKCVGQGDDSFDWVIRTCNNAGMIVTAPDTKTQETKVKREKRLQKINEEIRTPSADGTPKLTEKFPDIDAILNDPHANITKLHEPPAGTPDDLIAMPIDDLPDQPDLPEYHIFEPLTLDSILETPPLDFLTDNLIVRNTVNVFFAPAKTGKTYLCLYYAICMAKGIPFLGMENHLQRNVGYLNLDMFRGGFNDRVKQVIRGFDPNSTHEDIQNILSRLKIIDREAIRSALGNTPNFFTKDYLDDLKNFIVTNDIEFLFIDTFSRIRAGSKENDNDHMGLVLQNAEEFFTPLNCGCLFIHHTGKDEQTIRGAQALIDNSEFVFGLRKVNKSNKHLQLYSDTPRYTDVFELDVYPVFQQITNEETGAKHAESYFLTTTDPDNKNSDIVDFLKAHKNPYMSKTNLAKAVGGNYGDRLKEVDALYAQGVMVRVKAGNGFNYKLKSA